ncbi:twin-arginine translocation signal domain-containing protein [Frigoriglobus tundricola]|uniref:Twin-arginine translocation signal domain-containing protein n=1 Tax=Frigoriglobus tundricola TaxID=2774151 RepID=A0A6M5Z4I4_9BACT|nr:twin-arginine translocation signal domain-containing protein [Frigoriglobus tundricola]QJX00402.1 hypothetical protein FTUN_8032 [Frigoriglobus tundricola]
MSSSPDRRAFLQSSAAAGGLAFVSGLPAVSRADAEVAPNLVRLEPEIEPLVRLIEDAPREKLLEEIAARMKKGISYREVLAGLLLAGVRNVQPRPVGFKFHAVLVVNAAHQAALAGPDQERWLPLFWALDNFKGAQAQNQREGGWRMKPADPTKVPAPLKAREAFTTAMDEWDVEAADAAVVGLARVATPGELFDLFARYGSRDFRDIGHKIIYVSGAFRALEVIGWQHAEPVLRSLAYALLHHDGKNPAKEDLEPDRPGRRNAERAGKAGVRRAGDGDGAGSDATGAVLKALRTGSADDLGAEVASRIGAGSAQRSVWDGLQLGAGELLMRQPGIVGLHTLTTMNAMRYAHRTTGDADLRAFLLLQAASFLPMFRDAMKARGKLGDLQIDELTARDGAVRFTVRDVYAELSLSKEAAAKTALSVLKADRNNAKELIDEGRRLIFLKGTDSHDYKFSSAVMEDAALLAPEWRDRFLAASVFWLKGSETPDAPLVKRTRAALA